MWDWIESVNIQYYFDTSYSEWNTNTLSLLERVLQGTINKFMQKFYRQDSVSFKGKYPHYEHGFLEDIAHRILLRGFLILKKEDVERVGDFKSKYDLIVLVGEIKLMLDD